MGGPVGVITGGLSGIGAAVALKFASLDAHMVIADRSSAGGDELREQVRRAGGVAVVEPLDVRDPDAQERVAKRAVAEGGRIDFLVANAGIADQSRVAAGDPKRWREVIETNLLGVILSCRAVLPTMLDQDSGHIFLMSSVSGRESYVGEPVYVASKWGQVGFGHALRLELLDAGSHVRVTIVEPGLVDTPLTRGNPKVAELLDEIEPLDPADIAEAVAYAYTQPGRVVVSELTVRPVGQVLPRL